ncbi:twin-arginine translocase TatA/TatE family subunit [Verrucomicrobiota bacterium]
MTIPIAFFGGSPGAGEILLVLVVLLLLFGARRLPSIARSLGRTLEGFRRAARDLSHDIITGDGDYDALRPPSNIDSPDSPSNERKG